MQGEWGTGKTSLMYMIREKLDSFSEENDAIATSWVNTGSILCLKESIKLLLRF